MKKHLVLLGLLLVTILLWANAALADYTIAANTTYDLSQVDSNAVLTINSGLTVTLTNTTDATFTNLAIVCGDHVDLTIDSLIINDASNAGVAALRFSGPGSTLTLVGESTLRSGQKQPGVSLEGSTTSLTIQGNGALNAYGGYMAAGIGGGSYWATSLHGSPYPYGTLTINSGTIYAKGGMGGAGIGSGQYRSDGGSINIYGGTITAEHTQYATGIGSGYLESSCGEINIYGGTIKATGHTGIGGGFYGCSNGDITISGGTVYALGTTGGCGIGNGQLADGKNKVEISGGLIYAKGWSSSSGEMDIDAIELSITGDAAIFLRYNRCVTPTVNPNHTRITKSATQMVLVDGTIYGLAGTGVTPWTSAAGGWFIQRVLTYNANGGSGTVPASSDYHITGQATVASGSSLTRSGYVFSGWERTTTSGTAIYQPADLLTVSENITLYALWSPTYTVLFDSLGGSSVASQTVAAGGLVSVPSAPSYSGYVFAGWYTSTAFTTPWDFNADTVSANMTLYAKWTAECTAVFDSQGGSTVESQTMYAGDLLSQPANPTRTGYTFDGWYTDTAYTTPWNFSADTITSNIVLFAKWTADVPDMSDMPETGDDHDSTLYIVFTLLMLGGIGIRAYIVRFKTNK